MKKNYQDIKLTDNNLGNDGVAALCEGLKMNNSVTVLNLRSLIKHIKMGNGS